jgi:hypothetical protein
MVDCASFTLEDLGCLIYGAHVTTVGYRCQGKATNYDAKVFTKAHKELCLVAWSPLIVLDGT